MAKRKHKPAKSSWLDGVKGDPLLEALARIPVDLELTLEECCQDIRDIRAYGAPQRRGRTGSADRHR